MNMGGLSYSGELTEDSGVSSTYSRDSTKEFSLSSIYPLARKLWLVSKYLSKGSPSNKHFYAPYQNK